MGIPGGEKAAAASLLPVSQIVEARRKYGLQRKLFLYVWGLLFAIAALYRWQIALTDSPSEFALWNKFVGAFVSSPEKRARRILSSHPLIDGHNDLAIRIRADWRNDINSEDFTARMENGTLAGEFDLVRAKEGGYGGAFWSVFYLCQNNISDFSDDTYNQVTRATYEQIDVISRLKAHYPKHFGRASTAAEALHDFERHGKLVSPLGVEGLHQIGNSAATLRSYFELGVRYATLNWNCHNVFSDAAVLTFLQNRTSIVAPPLHYGVSRRGRDLIYEMNRIGMMVDLSHVSHTTMRDVLVGDHAGDIKEAWKGSIAPPIFSHSSAYAVCPHPRNVPDDVLELVKLRKSVVMVNFNPGFVSCGPPREGDETGMPEEFPEKATLLEIVRHIRHIGDTIGYDYVGIGTDFDGIQERPAGCEDVSKMPDLVAELLRQGLSRADVIKVIGGNILRVWREVEATSLRLKREGMLPLQDEPKGLF